MSEPASLAVARRRSPDVFPLRLAGPLDIGAVDHVRNVLDSVARDATHVVLHCERVSAVEPAAAACLWDLCRGTERGGRRQVRIQGLPDRFLRRLRLHPLIGYVIGEDEIFEDPFGRILPSAR